MSVQLAQRLQRIRPSATVSITAKAIQLKETGRDVISLSAGEPDFDTPQHIKNAAIEAIRAGYTKYTAIEGASNLKAAIARKFRRDNHLNYEPAQILVTSGAKQACFNACQAVLDPGDEAIIPAPYWVSYPEMVRLADAQPVIVRTKEESGFLMGPNKLAAAITPQTRLLIVNSPCNPSGAVYSADQWRALGGVLAEHPRILILADDIYEHIYWDESPFATVAEACPSLYERTITVNGVSKCYAMSGWRVGYAAGPQKIISAMTALQSQSTTNACSISQAAAVEALDGDQACVRQMCDQFRQRHDWLLQRLNSIPGVHCAAGHGAFYLLPNIESLLSRSSSSTDLEFCEQLLDQQGLALVPGLAFGAPGHIRISFAASLPLLENAMSRLEIFAAR